MKTIHRLVLKSYLGPMVLTFFIVMFVLMMNIVWRYIDELVGKGLSAGIIIELMTYFMANMIPMGLPLSMLLAAIMTMGNLGENYELLAMKSAGMSLVCGRDRGTAARPAPRRRHPSTLFPRRRWSFRALRTILYSPQRVCMKSDRSHVVL